MKACYANGVLSAFEEAGHRPFDAVLGTSAGGALAAWFSAGQARYAEGTWAYANDRRILNYVRFLTLRGPLLDHEALLDIVYLDEHPIDQGAVQAAPWPVIVTAVDVETAEVVYQDLRTAGEGIIPWLKATGRLPFGSGPPVPIGGREFVDGGVVDPIPVRWAVEALGATQITLISNNAVGTMKPDSPATARLVGRRYPALEPGVARHNAIKAAAMEYALKPPNGVRIDVIRPAEPTGLTRLTRDGRALSRIIEMGRADGQRFIAAGGVALEPAVAARPQP